VNRIFILLYGICDRWFSSSLFATDISYLVLNGEDQCINHQVKPLKLFFRFPLCYNITWPLVSYFGSHLLDLGSLPSRSLSLSTCFLKLLLYTWALLQRRTQAEINIPNADRPGGRLGDQHKNFHPLDQ